MAKAEPAMVDIHGALWTGRDDYELVPSAKRYELYEMSYAAKVCLYFCSTGLSIMCSLQSKCTSRDNHTVEH